MRLIVLVSIAGCGSDSPARPAPLEPLPPPATVETDRFRDVEACGQCHLAEATDLALHDAAGNNVSPVLLWRSSMMALAARDPYYLAVFAEERDRAADPAAVDALCTRCHAPAGSEEASVDGGFVGFAELTGGSSPAAVLGRTGISCTLCHQIAPGNLGEERSFTGGFAVGYDHALFGPYRNPVTMPMQLIVNYEPTFGDHILGSELCATCHTVVVPTPAGEVVEQATFLEWRSSALRGEGRTCQSCHVPAVDDAGQPIITPVSRFPDTLGNRQPVGRHTFVGGNAYVLSLLADATTWSNAGVDADELLASAARSEAHLREAARLSIAEARRDGDDLIVVVRVENLTGHKLPTGYPSRRAWLHLAVRAGGEPIFESGATDAAGAIVDGEGHPLAPQPHRDEILAADQVQIWEASLVDVDGRITHRALDARRYGKDDRILPRGFAPTASDRARTEPVGVVNDPSFAAGADDVTYRISGVPAGAAIDVELLYQSLRPDIVDAIDAAATPAGTRFVDLVRARPISTVRLATASQLAP